MNRVGLLLVILALSLNVTAAEWQSAPIDTSSPRATVESFLAMTDEAGQRYIDYRNVPSKKTQNALLYSQRKSLRLLDLSEVPPATREDVGFASFLLLWEILSRLDLPDLEDIPGAIDSAQSLPNHWRLPGTEIVIKRVSDDEGVGDYRFSSGTVSRAQEFFDMVRYQPLLRELPADDLYRTEQLIAGWWIPYTWVEGLPQWANYSILGQVIWKWLLLFAVLALAVLGSKLAYSWSTKEPLVGAVSSCIRHLVTPLVLFLFAMFLTFVSQQQINVTGSAAPFSNFLAEIASGVALVWAVWIAADWIALGIIEAPSIDEQSLEAHLIRLAAKLVGIVATLVLVFQIMNQLGVPVYGIVAGAGVGGVAIALAAQNTLENFMGTLNLFADHPVKIGDMCRYDNDSEPGWRPVGRIESIGLRSTKIRRLDRTLVTIPNAEFAQRHIVNFDVCDRMLMNQKIGLRYETSDDQLRFILAETRKLLHAHPKSLHTRAEPIRVRFMAYGDYSLDVGIRVYLKARGYDDFAAIQEDILLRIKSVVESGGSGFAFPSRTIYMAEDSGTNAKNAAYAQDQVQAWRDSDQLPFPDYSAEALREISGTLDYPPKGAQKPRQT